jgi:hypothetical protein
LFVGPALGDGYAKCHGTATPCYLEQSTRDLMGRAHGSLLSGGVALAAHAFNPQPDPPGQADRRRGEPPLPGTAIHDIPVVQAEAAAIPNSEASPDAFPLPASRRRAPRSVSGTAPSNERENDQPTFVTHESFLFTEEYCANHDAMHSFHSNYQS